MILRSFMRIFLFCLCYLFATNASADIEKGKQYLKQGKRSHALVEFYHSAKNDEVEGQWLYGSALILSDLQREEGVKWLEKAAISGFYEAQMPYSFYVLFPPLYKEFNNKVPYQKVCLDYVFPHKNRDDLDLKQKKIFRLLKARCYELGFGGEKKLADAISEYEKLAREGNEIGWRMYRELCWNNASASPLCEYEKMIYVEVAFNSKAQEDVKKQELSLEAKKNSDDPDVLFALSQSEEDPQKRYKLLRQSASQGNYYAIMALCDSFEQSDIDLIKRLAKEGNQVAQRQLGFYFLYGLKDYEKKPKEGYKLLHSSAEQGDMSAAFLLAEAYSTDELGDEDPVKSYKYAKIASILGFYSTSVKRILDMVTPKLNDKQKEDADRWVKAWRPKG